MSDPARTLDQRRAAHAWEAVRRVQREIVPDKQGGYAREAKRLTMRITTAGLGQALAFLRAKAGGDQQHPNSRLLRDLSAWVLRERFGRTLPETDLDAALLRAIVEEDALFLRRATAETLTYLQWLTRFAEAEIGALDND